MGSTATSKKWEGFVERKKLKTMSLKKRCVPENWAQCRNVWRRNKDKSIDQAADRSNALSKKL
jgi:hypothetical protein